MRHLIEQHVAKKEGSVVPLTIQITQKYLEEAAAFFSRGMRTGEDVDVASISVDDVRRYVFLLTGGRKSEVFGLAIDDVNVERKTITFRPHPWRRLKTLTSHRVVPLWPQLEKILRD